MTELHFRVGTELTHTMDPPHPGLGKVLGHKEHPRCLPILTLLRDPGWLAGLDLGLWEESEGPGRAKRLSSFLAVVL